MEKQLHLQQKILIEASASKDFDTQQDGAVTVVLDKRLTPELIEEGYVREIISKVQSMRKEADFEVTDRITVYMTNNDKLAEIVTRNADMIKARSSCRLHPAWRNEGLH